MYKKFSIGFENELIIVDPITKSPIYQHHGEPISTSIINIISKTHSLFIQKGMIKKELDACQIEITNNGGKKSINEAIDEMLILFNIVEKASQELGYIISPSVVPPQNFTTISSGGKEYYEDIIQTLKNAGVEKSTNIAGLHCNIGSQNKGEILALHYNLSLKVLQGLETNLLSTLLMSEERFKHYLNVVQVMKLDYLPKVANQCNSLERFYLDANGNPKSSYEFVRLKKLLEPDVYISELRTPDAGTSLKNLEEKMLNTYKFIFEL